VTSTPTRLKSALPATLAILSLAALGLAGCSVSGTPTPSATACDPVASGPDSDAVTVTGDLDKAVTISIDGTLSPTTTERSVVVAGSGAPAQPGQTVNAYFSAFSATDGTLIESGPTEAPDTPTPFVLDDTLYISGLIKALSCSTAGSRIVAVIPPADLGSNASAIGLGDDESLVFVADVVSIEDTPTSTPTPVPSVDLPTPQAWDGTAAIPDVDMSTTVPTVTIPAADPSPLLLEKVLEEGDGAVVPNGSTVTVDYVGVNWADGTVFDSSYSRGQAASFATNEVIPGFAAAIVGQKVGSTVLVSIPPDYGYSESSGSSLVGDTLVFLVQILDAQ